MTDKPTQNTGLLSDTLTAVSTGAKVIAQHPNTQTGMPSFVRRRAQRWAYHSDRRTDRGPAVLAPAVAAGRPTVGRNDPCPCGSGKKFKKCCHDT